MKKNLLALAPFVLLVGISCQQEIDLEAEKKAIVNVLEEESDAVVDLDYDRLSKTWLQTATATFVSSGRNNFEILDGFEGIERFSI